MRKFWKGSSGLIKKLNKNFYLSENSDANLNVNSETNQIT